MNATLVKEPIYQQLNHLLRSLIDSGEFPVGSKFLTEREICERFKVSRVTANKALSNLVSEGLVEFRKGVGTFVRGRPMDYNLRALVSFTDEARAAGKRPETRVLEFKSYPARFVPDKGATLLNAQPDEMVLYMERLRLADGMPVILEKRYVVARHCPGFSREDAEGSIYAAWVEEYKLVVEGADQTIRAVNIRGADARALDVREGVAGLLVTSLGFLAGGDPLWFERTLYRSDSYEFHNRLAGIQPAGKPSGRFLDRGVD